MRLRFVCRIHNNKQFAMKLFFITAIVPILKKKGHINRFLSEVCLMGFLNPNEPVLVSRD